MPTTVHLPPDLLESVDLCAKELGMSRNRFVIRASERAIHEKAEWSEDFVKVLSESGRDVDSHRAIDEMRAAISSARRSKNPPAL